jgi:hypothetical protein
MGKVKEKMNLGVLRVHPYLSKGVPQSWLDLRFSFFFFNSVDGCYCFGILGYKIIFTWK